MTDLSPGGKLQQCLYGGLSVFFGFEGDENDEEKARRIAGRGEEKLSRRPEHMIYAYLSVRCVR